MLQSRACSSSDPIPSARFVPGACGFVEGVCQFRAASVSVVPECRPLSVEYAAAPEEAESLLVAVGQHEDSGSLVRSADIGRSHNRPLRIEPESGKVGQPPPEPVWMSNSAPDILQERERGACSSKGSADERPEVALVVGAPALAGAGERRAGKARHHDVHRASKRASREALQIRPDRRAIQGRVFHPRQEDRLSEGFPLDVAHGSTPSGNAKVESADSGAEREGTQSHATRAMDHAPLATSSRAARAVSASRLWCAQWQRWHSHRISSGFE